MPIFENIKDKIINQHENPKSEGISGSLTEYFVEIERKKQDKTGKNNANQGSRLETPDYDLKSRFQFGGEYHDTRAWNLLTTLLNAHSKTLFNGIKSGEIQSKSVDEHIIPLQKMVFDELCERANPKSPNYYKKLFLLELKNVPINADFFHYFVASRLGEFELPELESWKHQPPSELDLHLFLFDDKSILSFASVPEKYKGDLSFYNRFLQTNAHKFKGFIASNKAHIEKEIRKWETLNPIQAERMKFQLDNTIQLNQSNFMTIFQSFGQGFFVAFKDMYEWLEWAAYPAFKTSLQRDFEKYMEYALNDFVEPEKRKENHDKQ